MAVWDRLGFVPPTLPQLPSVPSDALNAMDVNQSLYAQAQQNQWALAQQAQQQVQQYNLEPSIHQKATHLLKLRLAGLDSQFHISADEFLACHVANGTVYIFFVIGDRAGNLQEETALFPSDRLITQFRLIR